MKQVFFLGATGYIGGSLLRALKEKYPELVYLALVRSPSAIRAVEAAGASVVQGAFSDFKKIAELSQQSDIVVNAADSDDVELSRAILMGLKARYENGDGVATLLHTSGTCNFLGDESGGSEDKVWTDSEADVKLIHPDMVHGPVDRLVLKAGEEGYVNTFIVCPSMVHGRSSGPIDRSPILLKMLVPPMLERKHAYCIGDGSRRSGVIDMEDLIRAFLLVSDQAFSAGSTNLTTSPYSRYFIATSAPMKWKDIFSLVAGALYQLEKLESTELVETPAEELGFIGRVATLGTNERLGRLAELGWTPEAPDFQMTVMDDVQDTLRELGL